MQQHLFAGQQQYFQLQEQARQAQQSAVQSAKLVEESAAKIAELDLLVLNRGWRAETYQPSPGATRMYYWHVADRDAGRLNDATDHSASSVGRAASILSGSLTGEEG